MEHCVIALMEGGPGFATLVDEFPRGHSVNDDVSLLVSDEDGALVGGACHAQDTRVEGMLP